MNSHPLVESKDTVYISGLPSTVTEKSLCDHFGSIGMLKDDKKKPNVWIYYDRETKLPKGDATITYEDPGSVTAAIEWFNNKEFQGSTITVDKAQVKDWRFKEPKGGRGGRFPNRSRGDSDNKSRQGLGFQKRADDWNCPRLEHVLFGVHAHCNNLNYSYRTSCFRCSAGKPTGSVTESRPEEPIRPPPPTNDHKSTGFPGSRQSEPASDSGSSHRSRNPREQREPRESRDFREPKEFRESREPRDFRDSRDSRDKSDRSDRKHRPY